MSRMISTKAADYPPINLWDAEANIAETMAAHPVRKNTIKNEGDGYDFYADEQRLAKELGSAMARATDIALKEFDKMVGLEAQTTTSRKGKMIDDRNLAKELEKLDPILSNAWTNSTEKTVAGFISWLVEKGAKRTTGWQHLKNLPTRPLIEAGMVASSKYYTNSYFNRIVMPAITGDILTKLDGGQPFDDTFYRALRSKMDQRLKSVPYWRLTANQAASRSYHYGLTRAGLAAGKTGYRFSAILDEKTSDQCEFMHGKTFWLADAVDYVEDVATLRPEDIPTDDPWIVDAIELEGLSPKQLMDRGAAVPPLHPFCRSSMELI